MKLSINSLYLSNSMSYWTCSSLVNLRNLLKIISFSWLQKQRDETSLIVSVISLGKLAAQ
jgi:hypothetical protein